MEEGRIVTPVRTTTRLESRQLTVKQPAIMCPFHFKFALETYGLVGVAHFPKPIDKRCAILFAFGRILSRQERSRAIVCYA